MCRSYFWLKQKQKDSKQICSYETMIASILPMDNLEKAQLSLIKVEEEHKARMAKHQEDLSNKTFLLASDQSQLERANQEHEGVSICKMMEL